MIPLYVGDDVNELWSHVAFDLLDRPEYLSSPRRQPIREITGVQVRLTDPTRSILGVEGRRLNYHFMVAEAIWMLCGFNRVDMIRPFNKNITMAADDIGETFRGAYGPKIVEQMDYVLESLAEDIDSRRAVMTIWRERPRASRDIPCTVSFQFLVRDGRLQLHTYMRSNDVWLGFPYDVFNFTLLQQVVAFLTGQDVGSYVHTVGSMHLYERNASDARDSLKTCTVDARVRKITSWPVRTLTSMYSSLCAGEEGWHETCSSRLDEPWRSMAGVLHRRFHDHPVLPHPWENLLRIRG